MAVGSLSPFSLSDRFVGMADEAHPAYCGGEVRAISRDVHLRCYLAQRGAEGEGNATSSLLPASALKADRQFPCQPFRVAPRAAPDPHPTARRVPATPSDGDDPPHYLCGGSGSPVGGCSRLLVTSPQQGSRPLPGRRTLTLRRLGHRIYSSDPRYIVERSPAKPPATSTSIWCST